MKPEIPSSIHSITLNWKENETKNLTVGLMVYGLNPYDDPNIKQEVAQKFLDKFKVTYPEVFVPKTVPEQYQIKVYLSMYMVKNGHIVYAHLGYSEAQMKELKAKILELLPKR